MKSYRPVPVVVNANSCAPLGWASLTMVMLPCLVLVSVQVMVAPARMLVAGIVTSPVAGFTVALNVTGELPLTAALLSVHVAPLRTNPAAGCSITLTALPLACTSTGVFGEPAVLSALAEVIGPGTDARLPPDADVNVAVVAAPSLATLALAKATLASFSLVKVQRMVEPAAVAAGFRST